MRQLENIVTFQRGEFELPSVQHAKERKVNVEIRFSLEKFTRETTYEICSGRDSGLLVESGFNANPPVAPFIFLASTCARAYLCTHERMVVNGRACGGLGQLGLPSIANSFSFRATGVPDMHGAPAASSLHCADTWSGIHRNCTFTEQEYLRVA